MKDLDSLSESVMASPDLLPVPLKGLFKTSRNAGDGGGGGGGGGCLFALIAVLAELLSQ